LIRIRVNISTRCVVQPIRFERNSDDEVGIAIVVVVVVVFFK